MGTPVTSLPVPTKTLAEAIAQIVASIDTHLGSTLWRTGNGATYTMALVGDTLRLSDGTTNQDVSLAAYKDGGRSTDTDNLILNGTDGRALLTLSATEQGVPNTGTYVLGWVNGVLSAIPA